MNNDMNDDNQSAKSAAPAGRMDFNTTIQSLWQGKIPLVQTFWLYYFCAMFVLGLLGNILPGLSNLFALFQLILAGFMVRPIIISADKYTGPSHWALLAKIAAVLIGIGVIARLLF